MATIVEMINPLTGLPEQVDKLDHTAQEIDDAVGLAPQLSNPNLLDNWYFANPVNQRGQMEYTGEVYGIDRWIAQWTGAGATLIEDGCVSIYRTDWESYLCQRITDGLGGQTVTFSALCKGNCGINLIECDSGWAFKSNIAGQGNTVIDDYTLFTVTGVVPQGCKNLLVQFTSAQGAKSQFKAAKLELGSQQTLARQDENGNWVLNEIPDYGEQLARCQRYFQTFATESLRPTNALDFRPVMRATPALSTITVGGKTLYTASADL